jgi:hypothetical protein
MKFEIGQSYKVRWISDSNIDDIRKVVNRTAKTITFESGESKKIFNDNDGEYCYPEGKYSMAPVMRAKGVVK